MHVSGEAAASVLAYACPIPGTIIPARKKKKKKNYSSGEIEDFVVDLSVDVEGPGT